MSDRDYIETAHDIMGESERLKNDYHSLEKDFENFKTILNQTIQNKQDIYDKNKLEGIAKYICDLTNSKISNDYLISLLDDIYSYMDIDWRHLFPKCHCVARKILYKTNIDSSIYNYADAILQDIKKQSISLTETQKNLVKAKFGERYTQVLSHNFPLSERGVSLSIVWKKLNLQYPEIFTKYTSEEIQAVELFNICDILKKVSETLNDYCEEEYLRWLANEIYDKCWFIYNIKNSPLIKNLQLQREHENLILRLRNEFEERQKEHTHNNKKNFEKAYFYLYNKKQKEIEEIKRHSAERMNQILLEAKVKSRIMSQNAKERMMDIDNKKYQTKEITDKTQNIKPSVKNKWNYIFCAVIGFILSGLYLLGTADMEYSYYQFVRVISFIVIPIFLYVFWKIEKIDDSLDRLLYIPSAIVWMLFNPIFPFYMSKENWIIFDVICAIVFLIINIFLLFLYRYNRKN